MSTNEIIAYHGWAFDSGLWNAMKAHVSTVRWKFFDRGYFGSGSRPVFSDEANYKIIITHSFGLHHCKPDMFKTADLLVIISGFLHFHPVTAQMRRRSQLVLNDMIKQFRNEPDKVLKAFYRNAFNPQPPDKLPDHPMAHSLLLNDLEYLDESKMSQPELKKSAKVCIFHGTDDAIVTKEKGRGIFDLYGEKAQYFEFQNAGHVLPITHANKCGEILKLMMQGLPND